MLPKEIRKWEGLRLKQTYKCEYPKKYSKNTFGIIWTLAEEFEKMILSWIDLIYHHFIKKIASEIYILLFWMRINLMPFPI